MIFVENFRIAFEALRANLMRSILTTLGIIIGVAAVIAVVSIIQGLQAMVTGLFQDVGSNFVMVQPDFSDQQQGLVGKPVELTWEDGRALEEEIPAIQLISPVIAGRKTVKHGKDSHDPELVVGCNDDVPEIYQFFVDEGRFFSSFDLRHRRKVAVVGREVVEELRLGDRPVGREIYVGTTPVTVVGVMEEKGQFLGQDLDDRIYIPFDTALSVFGREAGDRVALAIKTETVEQMPRVKDDIRRILRRRHGLEEGEEDDFQVIEQSDILETSQAVLGGITAVIGGVVSVALLVGGIGIMNIMLVSVTERTREIGIRKAVGARRRDILVQFLIEAITLSLLGGGIGLALGWGLGALVIAVLPVDLPPAYVPLWAVVLAIGFSLSVGVFFGIYPAGKASRLDPIDALRYE